MNPDILNQKFKFYVYVPADLNPIEGMDRKEAKGNFSLKPESTEKSNFDKYKDMPTEEEKEGFRKNLSSEERDKLDTQLFKEGFGMQAATQMGSQMEKTRKRMKENDRQV